MNNQFIFFDIGEQSYGMDIMSVKEIITISTFTDLPMSRPEVKGVINLRGSVVPIIDLREVILKKEQSINTDTARIIVTLVDDDRLSQCVGYIVTSVDNVRTVNDSQMEILSGKTGITTLYKEEDNITIIIDPIKLLEGVI